MEAIIWEPIGEDIYTAAIAVPCHDHNHADGIKNFETIIDFMVGG